MRDTNDNSYMYNMTLDFTYILILCLHVYTMYIFHISFDTQTLKSDKEKEAAKHEEEVQELLDKHNTEQMEIGQSILMVLVVYTCSHNYNVHCTGVHVHVYTCACYACMILLLLYYCIQP